MKTGVSMTPWLSVRRPRRAWASVPRISNFNIRALSPAQAERAVRSARTARRAFVSRRMQAHPPSGSAAFADHQAVGLAPLGQFRLDLGTGATGLRFRHRGDGRGVGAL